MKGKGPNPQVGAQQQPALEVVGNVTPEELKVLQTQEGEKNKALTELGRVFYHCLEAAQGVAQIDNKRQMFFNGLGQKYEIPQFIQWSVTNTGEIHALYPPGVKEQLAAAKAAAQAEQEAKPAEATTEATEEVIPFAQKETPTES